MSQIIEIYTDGSCIPNPGKGGWAWIQKGTSVFSTGNESPSTNQRMELRAIIEAIRAAEPGRGMVIFTDSQFAIKGATIWCRGWVSNGWRKADGSPVKNRDLWEELWKLLGERVVRFEWVRGHNGNEWNEKVDRLANDASGADEFDRAEMNRRISAQKSWKPRRNRWT